MVIQCGHHKKRKYLLDLNKSPGKHVLEVVATKDRPDEIELRFSGKCENGNPSRSPDSENSDAATRGNEKGYCPWVRVSGPDTSVEQPSKVKVKVRPLPEPDLARARPPR